MTDLYSYTYRGQMVAVLDLGSALDIVRVRTAESDVTVTGSPEAGWHIQGGRRGDWAIERITGAAL